jgi:chitin synthase
LPRLADTLSSQVKLTQGNLVLDCPVPTKLQSFLTRRGDDEFTRMRYTAVTCDPDDFASSHFTLRPAMLSASCASCCDMTNR